MSGRRKEPATATLTVRLTEDLKARLLAAATSGPYEITATSIVARGIELALAELAAKFDANLGGAA